MTTCDTCQSHTHAEVMMAKSMADARAVAAMIRGDCAALLDARTQGVAATVARTADERRIWMDRNIGPLHGLIDRLDIQIRASMREVEVGCYFDGQNEHFRYETRVEPDPALKPIVALRDRAQALLERIEHVRDAIAAEDAVHSMRVRDGDAG
jgi:hypothetical protein